MNKRKNTLERIGKGVYTVPQAARLTGVSAQRIHHWLRNSTDSVSRSRLWHADYERLENSSGLSFADLIEIRFVDAFRSHGVSWNVIREAAARATELFNTTHPLSSRQFKTDGRHIFAELIDSIGEFKLINLVKNQYALKEIIAPSLYNGLTFSDDGLEVLKWRPHGDKCVVLDPKRVFGQPIIDDSGVPTDVLFQSWRVEQSKTRVAAIYEIPKKAVHDAIKFEQSLAA